MKLVKPSNFFINFFTQRTLHIIAPHTGINKMRSVSQILGSETALHKKTAVHVYQVKQVERPKDTQASQVATFVTQCFQSLG